MNGIKKGGATQRSQSLESIKRILLSCIVAALMCAPRLCAQDLPVSRLEGFDEYMEKLLKDWNAPAVGVGVVVSNKVAFAKGYGYRDYEKKLPFTPGTLCPIASNTKLFTAVAAGFLVEE